MIDDDVQAVQAARELGAALQGRGWLMGTAESCTGGLVAAAVTAVAGSSAWFDRAFVTYTNEAKVQQLGVAPQTLQEYGAVSEIVARQMAAGVLAAAPAARASVSTTGIAGPGGATPGKPVGMVCFGFALRTADGLVVQAGTCHFQGDRAAVRRQSVLHALQRLRALIEPR